MSALLTHELRAQLLANGRAGGDHPPAVKIFAAAGAATWLLSELDDDGRLFGLCDLGMGSPELGYVMLCELEGARDGLGLPLERDRWFEATAPLTAYADAARAAGQIIDTLPA